MMLLAGWRRTRPPRSGSPNQLFQHILGGALPRCSRCCTTVHNPCTRPAWQPTGIWHVSLLTLSLWCWHVKCADMSVFSPWHSLPDLVLQALLPGWILASGSQVSLLFPLKREHKVRCCLSILKACITTTPMAGFVRGTSDKLIDSQYAMICPNHFIVDRSGQRQAVPLESGKSHPTKQNPQTVTNQTNQPRHVQETNLLSRFK